MRNIPRHLVTTADERTWPDSGPMLFLGEWCQRLDRRQVWEQRDILVADPVGLEPGQRDADQAKVTAVEESLLKQLSAVLNEYHQEDHAPRYWRMLFGHWLRRYSRLLLNRLHTLEQCLERYAISAVTLLDDPRYCLAPQESYSAIWDATDDLWNQHLCARLIRRIPAAERAFDLQSVMVEDPRNLRRSGVGTMQFKVWLHNRLARMLGATFGMVGRRDEVFILNSYLPKAAEFGLQLMLRQRPYISGPFETRSDFRPDRELRGRLAAKIGTTSRCSEEQAIGSMLFEALPACYLELYPELKKAVSAMPWPKRPRVIFTSSNFDTDEVFKLWAAQKAEAGSTYVVGQHGNNYGTHRHQSYYSVEELTADRFLTWGWLDGLPQHTPAFMLKNVGRRPLGRDPDGEVLLIEVGMAHRIETWDVVKDYENYFEEQQNFVRALSLRVTETLRIRLYNPNSAVSRGEQSRWEALNPYLKLDPGTSRLDGLIAASRLVVFSYDSTGLLECLADDIPTIAFWQNGLENIRDSARPFYQQLIVAGIVHHSASSAAEKVNEVWDRVDDWWQSKIVQSARHAFCDRYARSVRHPLRNLQAILDTA